MRVQLRSWREELHRVVSATMGSSLGNVRVSDWRQCIGVIVDDLVEILVILPLLLQLVVVTQMRNKIPQMRLFDIGVDDDGTALPAMSGM